jgi:superfamily II DNA or RNA helicase
MNSLKNILWNEQYDTSEEDVINDFYKPALENSITFERATGFFSTELLFESMDSLRSFVMNDGRMRFIVSPLLKESEVYEIQDLLKDPEKAIMLFEEQFLGSVDKSELELRSAQLFVALQEKGYLEVRIAVPRNEKGMFHQKISIYHDGIDYIVSNGSNNETLAAYLHNIESFDVFKSWIDESRVKTHISRFNRKWDGSNKNLKVYSFSEVIGVENLGRLKSEKSIIDLINLTKALQNSKTIGVSKLTLNFDPYYYQRIAAEKWLIAKKGILKFATGSGKTKTAIYALKELFNKEQNLFVVVLVPDKTLSYQWSKEFSKIGSIATVCNSDINWRSSLNEKIDFYRKGLKNFYVTIATTDTFFGERFNKYISRISDFVVIVDECHGITANNYLNNMPNVSYRLGLSATPESDFDDYRTKITLDYFDGILSEYSLEDAINDGKLTKYNYFPIEVDLNEEEIEEYNSYTKSISVLYSKENPTPEEIARRENLIYARSRILYNAESKINALKELLEGNPKIINHLIVYCGTSSGKDDGSLSQLQRVNQLLGRMNIPHAQYTGDETTLARDIGIKEFRNGTYNSLTAIKCLDEGVDIEEIENAIIMASSQSNREFVQRRGRLLRLSPGKLVANIYDFVITSKDERLESAVLSEMRRALEYSSIAINKNFTYEKYHQIYLDLKEKKDNEIRNSRDFETHRIPS